jgi:hypothetical protein
MSQVLELRPCERQNLHCADPFLVFSNPGTLEIALVKLLGVSVKESSDPIGFFGTGLKYAMASALRLGGSMTITTGGEQYEVSGQTIKLRDKAFTQITLNNEPLGFTTELGKQWEAWMVVRELYSNALDENGETFIGHDDPSEYERDDHTTIILRGQSFVDVWNDRDRYFIALDQERPVHTSKYVDAYISSQPSNTIFYRGIRIKDSGNASLYRYNLIESVMLTEDRTLKYDFQLKEALEKAIITSDDREFIYRSLTCCELFMEGHLDFSDPHSEVELSDKFKLVCADLLDRMPTNTNRRAVRFYQSRTQTTSALIPAQLTRVQTMQLEKAIAFVGKLGCDELPKFPIQVVRWLGEGILGQAKDGLIYLSVDCFDKGTKYLASTIYEEYVHCKYGFQDESRHLQEYLFDRVITMGEEYITGEPL